jgi:hypothetical protein
MTRHLRPAKRLLVSFGKSETLCGEDGCLRSFIASEVILNEVLVYPKRIRFSESEQLFGTSKLSLIRFLEVKRILGRQK